MVFGFGKRKAREIDVELDPVFETVQPFKAKSSEEVEAQRFDKERAAFNREKQRQDVKTGSARAKFEGERERERMRMSHKPRKASQRGGIDTFLGGVLRGSGAKTAGKPGKGLGGGGLTGQFDQNRGEDIVGATFNDDVSGGFGDIDEGRDGRGVDIVGVGESGAGVDIVGDGKRKKGKGGGFDIVGV